MYKNNMKWTENDINYAIKLNLEGKTYCEIGNLINRTKESVKTKLYRLGHKMNKPNAYENIVCENCDGEFSALKRIKRKFCSRSCSTTYNNHKQPKRKALMGSCNKCGDIINRRNKYCEGCRRKKIDEIDEMELKDVIYENHHKSSAFALVRSRARTKAKKLGMNKCAICGYDKHVEIAHKKSISSYSLNTKIKIINDENNLIALCRNDHWEYDHNMLEINLK